MMESTMLTRETVEMLLDARAQDGLTRFYDRLAAHEKHALDALLQPIAQAGGTSIVEHWPEMGLQLLWAWVEGQIRPKADLTTAAAWTKRTAHRPALALLAHHRFVPIPDLSSHYFRRPDEPPLETLCGLWDIASSSVYRYLDKGRQQVFALLDSVSTQTVVAESLRQFALQQVLEKVGIRVETQPAWHAQQAAYFKQQPLVALWHWQRARNWEAVADCMTQHALTLAQVDGIDVVLDGLTSAEMPQTDKVNLLLAIATVEIARGHDEAERAAYQAAIQTALEPENKAAFALIYSRLGQHYERRDRDRARAYFQDALTFFAQLPQPPTEQQSVAYTKTLIRLAWLYTTNNDPRAKALLDEASGHHQPLISQTRAELEQTWAEYHYRSGNLQQAIAHRQRALTSYETLGDKQGVLKTNVNLIALYAEARQFEQALAYHDAVTQMASHRSIDPQYLVSADINLGAAYFWQLDFDGAIAAYEASLDKSVAANLVHDIGRAHYDLAEVYFTRFMQAKQGTDERSGDRHIEQAIAYFKQGHFSVSLGMAKNLKQELLAKRKTDSEQRILPQEKALYFLELQEIERQRALLQTAPDAAAQVAARIAIAQSYAKISQQEFQHARLLSEQHQIGANFAQLNNIFPQSAGLGGNRLQHWKATVNLDPQFLERCLDHLQTHKRITKRAYADLCGLGQTSASTHLAQLTEAGLLIRRGKGRSTHYVLA